MTAVFPLDELAELPAARCGCAGRHLPGTCPDAYSRELEPDDATVAELQSVVVAMRHRGDSDELGELEDSLALYAAQLKHVRAEVRDPSSCRLQCIRLAMALAAAAVRYRERIDQP